VHRSLLMKRLYCPPSWSLSFSAPDSHSDSSVSTKCAPDVTTFNDSELSSAAGVLGNMFSTRSRTASHQCSSFLTCKGFNPREANLLKSSWSSTDKSVSHSIP
jgi:hypothetical protein